MNTFKYLTRMEFIKVDKVGIWFIKGDTLILNEIDIDCTDKIKVVEEYDKNISKGKLRFVVTTFQNEEINYHLVLIKKKDKTITIWSQDGTTEVRIQGLLRF